MAEDTSDRNKFYAVLLAAIMAGAGGNIGLGVVNPPRPDPFTGTNGRELEERVNKRIDKIEKAMEKHDIEAQGWKYRIIKLEQKK